MADPVRGIAAVGAVATVALGARWLLREAESREDQKERRLYDEFKRKREEWINGPASSTSTDEESAEAAQESTERQHRFCIAELTYAMGFAENFFQNVQKDLEKASVGDASWLLDGTDNVGLVLCGLAALFSDNEGGYRHLREKAAAIAEGDRARRFRSILGNSSNFGRAADHSTSAALGDAELATRVAEEVFAPQFWTGRFSRRGAATVLGRLRGVVDEVLRSGEKMLAETCDRDGLPRLGRDKLALVRKVLLCVLSAREKYGANIFQQLSVLGASRKDDIIGLPVFVDEQGHVYCGTDDADDSAACGPEERRLSASDVQDFAALFGLHCRQVRLHDRQGVVFLETGTKKTESSKSSSSTALALRTSGGGKHGFQEDDGFPDPRLNEKTSLLVEVCDPPGCGGGDDHRSPSHRLLVLANFELSPKILRSRFPQKSSPPGQAQREKKILEAQQAHRRVFLNLDFQHGRCALMRPSGRFERVISASGKSNLEVSGSGKAGKKAKKGKVEKSSPEVDTLFQAMMPIVERSINQDSGLGVMETARALNMLKDLPPPEKVEILKSLCSTGPGSSGALELDISDHLVPVPAPNRVAFGKTAETQTNASFEGGPPATANKSSADIIRDRAAHLQTYCKAVLQFCTKAKFALERLAALADKPDRPEHLTPTDLAGLSFEHFVALGSAHHGRAVPQFGVDQSKYVTEVLQSPQNRKRLLDLVVQLLKVACCSPIKVFPPYINHLKLHLTIASNTSSSP